MKVAIAAVAIAAILIAVAASFTYEAAITLVVGWIAFLGRVIPRMTVYWPSVVVGGAALVLFAASVQWIGSSVRQPWRFPWTAALVSMLLVSFAAGISIVGIVHQIGWLASTKEPMLDETLAPRGYDDVRNNIKQLGLAVLNYESAIDRLPPQASLDAEGAPLHGWETHILPYVGYMSSEIDKKKPWNDAANQKYFKCIIPEFINPDFRSPKLEDKDKYGLNHFAANSRVLTPGQSLKYSQIKDGQSTTLLLGEVNSAFSPWGRPLNARDPAIGVNRGPNSFGGPNGRRGAHFITVGGSARYIGEDIDSEVLRALSTPADGDNPD